LERGGEAVGIAFASHFPVGDDVDAGPLHVADCQHRGVVLGLLEVGLRDAPQVGLAHPGHLSAQLGAVDQPPGLGVAAYDSRGEQIVQENYDVTATGLNLAPLRLPQPTEAHSMRLSTLAVAVSLALGAGLLTGCDRDGDRTVSRTTPPAGSSSSSAGSTTTTPSAPSGSASGSASVDMSKKDSSSSSSASGTTTPSSPSSSASSSADATKKDSASGGSSSAPSSSSSASSTEKKQ